MTGERPPDAGDLDDIDADGVFHGAIVPRA
jgi:hypothetical protein